MDKSEIDLTHQLSGETHFPSARALQRLWRDGRVDELDRPVLGKKLPFAILCFAVAGGLGWFAVSIGLNDIVSWAVLAIAAMIAFNGASDLWRAIQFSASHLTLERESYRPGDILRGTLHCDSGLAVCDKIEFVLQYLCQVTVYPAPGLGRRRDIPETITLELHNKSFWIEGKTVPGKTLPLPIEIPIPEDPAAIPEPVGAATDAISEWNYLWRLTLLASTPDRDYKSEFILPIFDEE